MNIGDILLTYLRANLRSVVLGTIFCWSTIAYGQSDSTSFRKYDIWPVISYSPETKLTLGVLGYRYLDLTKSDPETTRSFVSFLALYTTTNQVITETGWDIFTDGNKFRFRGALEFARFPNRNYGIGNEASAIVTEYTFSDAVITDSVSRNYKRYSIMRVNFSPVVLREIQRHFYAGMNADIEYAWRFEELGDSVRITNGEAGIQLLERNTTGMRSGLGLNLVWDSRNYILNSTKGSLVDLSAIIYGRYFGSDYSYISARLDARKFINPVSNHTLALRGVLNFRYTKDESLPLRGLSKVGGARFVRGYFQGTYQDDHMVAVETEYRIPFWKDDNIAPFHQPWKRLGMVVFLSAAQVYGQSGGLQMDGFNLAAGTGLRILFNEDSRSNFRIDYAWGLAQNSDGKGKQQSGLYFFFAEAF